MRDQLGRVISIQKRPSRIVCLVPSLTELLVDLGLSDNIVGVTKFCVHPKNIRKKKKIVGGTKSIHLEKIKQLKPDFILCNKEENTPEIVAFCQEIAPVYVSDINTFEDFYTFLIDLGEVFQIEKSTQNLIEKVSKKRSAFKKKVLTRPVKKVAYLIWNNPVMVAGGANFINVLLKELQFKNIFENKKSRYPEINRMDLKDAELILLSSEPFPFTEKHISEFQQFTDAKIFCVDGEYFSWYGSRLLKAFDYFEELLAEMD
ncbi:ABC-type Fe3+-hydroxamate transport system substrate-binding protein [Leeuwenhoekiella aestuarii]|uniref:ABC-type Fe3+-hydroxamate transport system substrate-binding protein n=1 Tax=Leeuwenhoekiella aestuarii TaxID=2249426 RepID=A0A4Q0NS66_9FLAO|nr:helical backbone metal receptor [Leeuwenhoekiella aestuarii]RXG13955.1 ABC-type Fe3+-hydroxamate transport system substrate-binding protein [Leeuwenhoekiella aestuarii]RXG18702.1 ABC-type Fe3+-hydroxamate transport system substrate-binding protein [Leeuwenhoekiella aestuarii]